MKTPDDWPDLEPETVRAIQADALRHAAGLIQDSTEDGLPLDSALAMVRIKAGNLTL